MNCLFCHHTHFTSSVFENTIYHAKEFEYITCQSCRLVQIHPLPNESDYATMYSMNYYNYQTHEPSSTYDYIFRHIPSDKKTFLDYGCGSGKILTNAIARGLDVTGSDYGIELISHLKTSYPSASFYEISEFYSIDKTYDVIFISNVLEHLTNPKEIMDMLYQRLHPDGIFIIEGPIENNFTLAGMFRKLLFGFRKKVLGKKVSHAPVHIFYSNASNQRAFFEKIGLKTIRYDVLEHEWPFPSKFSEGTSFKLFLYYLVAKVSKVFGYIIPSNGNHFFYIGKK